MSITRNRKRIERRRWGRFIAASVQERQCGGCTECCRVLGVPELHKDAWTPCPHASVAVAEGSSSCGCGIYATRPASCRRYLCAWRQGYGADNSAPNKTGVVIDVAVPAEAIGVPYVLVWRTTRPESELGNGTRRERQRLAAQGVVSVLVTPDGRRLLTGPPQVLDKVRAFLVTHPL